MLFVCLFQCSPIDKVWHTQKSGHCIVFMQYEQGKSISNLCIDWMILIVPIRPVLKLQMPLSQKMLVFAAFMCGSLSVVCLIILPVHSFIHTNKGYSACIASTVRAIELSRYEVAHLGGEHFSILFT